MQVWGKFFHFFWKENVDFRLFEVQLIAEQTKIFHFLCTMSMQFMERIGLFIATALHSSRAHARAALRQGLTLSNFFVLFICYINFALAENKELYNIIKTAYHMIFCLFLHLQKIRRTRNTGKVNWTLLWGHFQTAF